MASTYEKIATTTLGSAATSTTFSSIPATYTDLVCVVTSTISSSGDAIYARVNGDTGSNYSSTRLYGDGSTPSTDRITSATSSALGLMGASQSTLIINVMNYVNATTYKTFLARSAANNFVEAAVGLWRNTAAITSLTVLTGGQTFQTGATFTLYGIKAA
jgi:hypothetical protein